MLSSAPATSDDPRVGGLLEALARSAARTPGREGALWIAIVPGSGPLAVASTADAALGIGVATLAGLGLCVAELLGAPASRPATTWSPKYLAARSGTAPSYHAVDRTALIARVRAPATRLRVIGRVTDTQLDLLEPPREEERAAGPGAPEDTGVIAVTVDRSGNELGRVRIRGHHATRPMSFAALIPISPEVERVEFRRGHLVMARAERALELPGRPSLELSATGGRVTASWAVPAAARPIVMTVEVSDRSEGRAGLGAAGRAALVQLGGHPAAVAPRSAASACASSPATAGTRSPATPSGSTWRRPCSARA